jgi:hypothetical protein
MASRGALAPVDIQGLLAAKQQGLLPTGDMRGYQPTLRDMLAEAASKAGRSMGLGDIIAQRMRDEAAVGMDFMPGLGEAVGAEDTARAYNAGNYGEAAVNGISTGLGAVPVGGDMAGGLLKAMFGGLMAKTADMGALNKAVKMANEGADKKAIWDATGWFKGADDQWRFEIDDSGAFTKGYGPMSEIMNKQGSRVRDVMRHPELLDAYPRIMNDVTVDPFIGAPGQKGTFDPNHNVLGLNDELRGSAMGSTILHELQHGIQTKEGFARGAHPEEYASGAMFHEKARSLQGDLSKELTGGLTYKPDEIIRDLKYADPDRVQAIVKAHGFDTTDEALAFLKKQDEMRTPYSQYKRTAGEVEARNVQTRMNMTPAERRAKAPWETQDVPDELQIVRRR